MKKTFSILFLVILFAACVDNNSQIAEQEMLATESFQKMTYSSSAIEVPTLALTFSTQATFVNFKGEEEGKVEKALDLIKRVVASEEFRSSILNKTYKGKKRFFDNNGLTNAKVYKKILEAAEKLNDAAKDNILDVELELYHDEDSNALGYTYPSVKRIWMNKKYFNDFEPYQVAGNLFHEWLHKLGFKHSVESTESRKHSIPYWVGYLVRDLAKDFSL